jgi:hypothetical protein
LARPWNKYITSEQKENDKKLQKERVKDIKPFMSKVYKIKEQGDTSKTTIINNEAA